MIFNKQNVTKGYQRNTYVDFYKSEYSFEANNYILEEVKNTLGIEVSEENYLSWSSPSVINNCVITVSRFNQLYVSDKLDLILGFCSASLCKHLVFRFQDSIEIEDIRSTLRNLSEYEIHSVLVICDFEEKYFSDDFGELIMSLPLNKKLIVLKSPFEKNFEDTMFFTQADGLYSTEKSQNDIQANLTFFSESLKFNTYFNRKLFIGEFGEIKNAPECTESYGNIEELDSADDLFNIVTSSGFQKYWRVHKELIDVCKECEFRHMCLDNRVPEKRKDNEWYHTSECEYNPFIGKWFSEEGFKTLEQCGVVSSDEDYAIDRPLISKLNKEIWSE